MKIIDAITTIRSAIDACAETQDDHGWQSAVAAAGLQSQGDKGKAGIDEDYVGTFGPLELRVNYTWRDTSKAFQLGPDRTRVKLELRQNGTTLDSYTNGYER
jgi:hypothetical protein